jgi:hypothetical protein
MMGHGYESNGWPEWNTPDPMPDGNAAAERIFSAGAGDTLPARDDPLWDAQEACRDDACVMREELGAESFSDLWAELHHLIQDPHPSDQSRDESYRDRFIELRALFDKYVDVAAGNRVAGLADYYEGER